MKKVCYFRRAAFNRLIFLPVTVSLLLSAAASLSGQTVFQSANTTWMIRDNNAAVYADYQTYKKNVDSVIQILERAIPAVEQFTGVILKKPVKAYLCEGEGWGAWAGGGDVGYNIGCFKSSGGMFWVKGVVIGEYCNNTTGFVSSEWPRDWWADGVWYFPGFVAIEAAKVAVDSVFALAWEKQERYPTYPVYNVYKNLQRENGWIYFQTLFNIVKMDSMNWSRIGANPSKIKTDYVIAYFSLVSGKNMASTFKAAGVSAADSVEVDAIISVRQRLVKATAARLNVRDIWTAYRSGDYARAKQLLDALNVGVARGPVPAFKPASAGTESIMTVFSLSGKEIFSGTPVEFRAMSRARQGQAVLVRFQTGRGLSPAAKLTVIP
jgi:hypothetical protein